LSCFFISILEPNLKMKLLPLGPTAETAPPIPSRLCRTTFSVENEAGLVSDYNSKKELYFGLRSWDTPALLRGSGGTASGRLLLFDFWNPPGSLSLTLYIGPGPKEIRRQLLDMARAHPDVFRITGNPNSNWTAILSRPFLNREMYEYADPIDRDNEIHKRWAEFLREDLPRIEAALTNEEWIWQSDEFDGGQSGRGERFGWGDGDIVITRRPDESERRASPDEPGGP